MEKTNDSSDPAAARAALADIDSAAKSVKDVPWPTWLYFANAALLTLMGLSRLTGERYLAFWMATAMVIVVLNLGVARRMGIQFAFPSSKGFLVLVGAAAVFLLAIVTIPVGFPGPTSYRWVIVACAVAAGVCYLVGSRIHYLSTRR